MCEDCRLIATAGCVVECVNVGKEKFIFQSDLKLITRDDCENKVQTAIRDYQIIATRELILGQSLSKGVEYKHPIRANGK